MNVPDEAPKLNPWPFLTGDAVLLGTAFFISTRSNTPLQGDALIAIVACVGLGAGLAVIPFLLNYTRRQDLALAERQNEIAALARTTATSAEQLGIAAASLHGIADQSHRALKHAEQLPQKMQEKINEFKAGLNEVTVTENEALAQENITLRTTETERLETVLTSVRKTVTELAALETTSRQHGVDLESRLTQLTDRLIGRLNRAAESIDEKIVALAAVRLPTPPQPHTPSPTAASPAVVPPSALPDESPKTVATPAASTAAAVSDDNSPAPASNHGAIKVVTLTPPGEEKPARKRPPRKAAAHSDELGLDLGAPEVSSAEETHSSLGEPAVSSDGNTRLLVTAYIGIGNKLFVRGDGPGLSWDKGIPLQFVSIGKWRWESPDVTAPVKLKIYKNDDLECTAVGAVSLDPGQQQEVTANF